MSTGTSVMHRVMLAIGALPWVRVFRNNVALAWVGNGKPIIIRGKPKTITLQPGDVVLRGGRPLHAGLMKGSSDLIGWVSRVIQPEDVGTRVAVFCSPEVKDGSGRLDADQRKWIETVQAAGGIAGVVRTGEEARALVSGESVT